MNTRADIRTRVRTRADITYSQFCTDAELDEWIKQGLLELYNLVILTAPDSFIEYADKTVPSDGKLAVATIAATYYKLRAVNDLTASSTNPPNVRRFQHTERDQLAPRYRDVGVYIEFRPYTFWSGRSVRLGYIPTAPYFTDDATEIDSRLAEWVEFIETEVAAKALEKQKDFGEAQALRLGRKDEIRKQLVAMIPEDMGEPEQAGEAAARWRRRDEDGSWR